MHMQQHELYIHRMSYLAMLKHHSVKREPGTKTFTDSLRGQIYLAKILAMVETTREPTEENSMSIQLL